MILINNKYRGIFLSLFIFTFGYPVIFGQNRVDTINCNPYLIKITLNGNYKETISNYEEGFTKIYSFSGGSYILVNCGSDITLPIIHDNIDTIFRKFKKDNFTEVIIGLKKSKKYFREEDYNKYSIVILYDNINQNDIEQFDKILDSLSIEKIAP
jgi:hypothetical protein